MSPLAVVVVILLAAGVLGLMLARRRFVVVTVAGASMEPTLRPGDRVLVRRRGTDPLRIGAIVVFREPDDNWPGAPAPRAASQGWVIKRIAALPGCAVPDSVRPAVGGAEAVPAGMLVVLGDGVRSGDSRQWGFIPADQALGLVVRKLAGTPAPGGRRRGSGKTTAPP
jgi:signal peptidase I